MSVANMLPELTQSPDSFPVSVPKKAEIPANASELVSLLLDKMSAKEAYVYLYARMAIEESAMDALMDKATLGLDGKGETIFGAALTMRNKPAKFVYSDPKLETLYAELENLKAKIKEREKFNQSIPPEGTGDPDTGVLIPRPEKIEQGVTLAVKLA